jgi:hypothetical protein
MEKKCDVHIPTTIHGGPARGFWLTLAVTDHAQENLARFGYTPNTKVRKLKNKIIYIYIYIYKDLSLFLATFQNLL